MYTLQSLGSNTCIFKYKYMCVLNSISRVFQILIQIYNITQNSI